MHKYFFSKKLLDIKLIIYDLFNATLEILPSGKHIYLTIFSYNKNHKQNY